MKKMILTVATIGFALGTMVHAKTTAESIDYHEKMAKAHQEVADCLKAGKSDAVCDKVMEKYSPKWQHKAKRKYEKMKKDIKKDLKEDTSG